MGTRYDEIIPPLQKFIERQHIVFTGTAARDGRVNISPKGMDSLRVLSPNRILWRNFTGSGNETAVHLEDSPRITLMWCAFEGPPTILRAYGTARSIHRTDEDWTWAESHFTPDKALRQFFDVKVDLVQKSCGYAVPLMDYSEDRDVLTKWAANKSEDDIHNYWRDRNATSLDGQPSGLAEKNGIA